MQTNIFRHCPERKTGNNDASHTRLRKSRVATFFTAHRLVVALCYNQPIFIVITQIPRHVGKECLSSSAAEHLCGVDRARCRQAEGLKTKHGQKSFSSMLPPDHRRTLTPAKNKRKTSEKQAKNKDFSFPLFRSTAYAIHEKILSSQQTIV